MNQKERLLYLIQYLINENPQYSGIEIPAALPDQKRLFRSLMNVRPPDSAPKEFLNIQDAYLMEETQKKQLVSIEDLTPVQKNIYLWQGDITALRTDAIVNAANSAMLGCFVPCHGCIDNAIHSAAGINLRLECHKMMQEQNKGEPVGTAKITKAYNLPCRYILHTVGPTVHGQLTERDCSLLAACYCSCLELAAFHKLKSIAFCCISTGEFHFPNETAAEIAIETVKNYQKKYKTELEVVFNVFKDKDFRIYQRYLTTDRGTGKTPF